MINRNNSGSQSPNNASWLSRNSKGIFQKLQLKHNSVGKKREKQTEQLTKYTLPEQKETIIELYNILLDKKNLDILDDKDVEFKREYFRKSMVVHLAGEILTNGMDENQETSFYNSYLKIIDPQENIPISPKEIKELSEKQPNERILYIQKLALTKDIKKAAKQVIEYSINTIYNDNASYINDKTMQLLLDTPPNRIVNEIAKLAKNDFEHPKHTSESSVSYNS